MLELRRRSSSRGEDAWVVGGAVRDELLGRTAARPRRRLPRSRARRPRCASRVGGRRRLPALGASTAPGGSLLDAEQDGRLLAAAWRLDRGRSRHARLQRSTRSPARRRRRGARPVSAAAPTSSAASLRAVSRDVFDDDPLGCCARVRLEDELGFRLDPQGGGARPGERARLRDTAGRGARCSTSCGGSRPTAYERPGRARPAGAARRAASTRACAHSTPRGSGWRSRSAERLRRLPISDELRRFVGILLRAEPPADGSPRAIHRFRRATEPWALEALAYVGRGRAWPTRSRGRAPARAGASRCCAATSSASEPGPEVGGCSSSIAEERAAGTISTREEALELVRRSLE